MLLHSGCSATSIIMDFLDYNKCTVALKTDDVYKIEMFDSRQKISDRLDKATDGHLKVDSVLIKDGSLWFDGISNNNTHIDNIILRNTSNSKIRVRFMCKDIVKFPKITGENIYEFYIGSEKLEYWIESINSNNHFTSWRLRAGNPRSIGFSDNFKLSLVTSPDIRKYYAEHPDPLLPVEDRFV